MPAISLLPTRRDFIASTAAVGAITVLPKQAAAAAEGDAIRPFHVDVPEEALADLRRRVVATRWPARRPSPTSPRACNWRSCRSSSRYWATDYDWRKVEAKLNALPMFVTEIDGLDIQFIHVRSMPERPADDHDARLAGLDPGVAEGHRPAHRPDRPWRQRRGRLPPRHPVDPRLRLLGKAEGPGWGSDRIGRAWASSCSGSDMSATCRRAATAARSSPTAWRCRTCRAARHPRQHARDRAGEIARPSPQVTRPRPV